MHVGWDRGVGEKERERREKRCIGSKNVLGLIDLVKKFASFHQYVHVPAVLHSLMFANYYLCRAGGDGGLGELLNWSLSRRPPTLPLLPPALRTPPNRQLHPPTPQHMILVAHHKHIMS